jgi:hypothetical protein
MTYRESSDNTESDAEWVGILPGLLPKPVQGSDQVQKVQDSKGSKRTPCQSSNNRNCLGIGALDLGIGVCCGFGQQTRQGALAWM